MPVLYLESIKNPTHRFRILKYDPDTKQGKLIGDLGCEFKQDLSRETIEKRGYTLKSYPDDQDPGLNEAKGTIPPPPKGFHQGEEE